MKSECTNKWRISNVSKYTSFNEPEITSSDIKQNISELHTKKQLNCNVTCIRNSDGPKADVILTPLNLMLKQHLYSGL